MPANISIRNGKAEAFTALTPAWWDRDGEYMADDYLTSDQVWGDRGILNFEYELRTVADAETGQPIPSFRHCVRTDTGVTVGCGMTDGYRIIQPRQAFKWLDSLMMDGATMRYASAGVLGKGEEIWILATVPSDDQPIEGEHHQRYILWTDRFDGGGTQKAFPCVTRVECANTLAIALGERDASTYKPIRHSGDIDGKLDAARQVMLDSVKAFDRYNADCRKLIAAQYSRADAEAFIEALFPTPAKDASSRTKSIRERKVQAVRNAIRDASNNVGDMGGSMYQLLNAATFAIDHSNVLTFRGDKRTNRFRSLMVGDGANLKRRAYDLLLTMAG